MKKTRVLIVEDQPIVCRLLQRFLETVDPGYEVAEAGDGEKGLDLFHSFQPDLVITDIGLPGLSGLEMCGLIKRERPGAVVIIISGLDTVERRDSATAAGAADFLRKPFTFSEFTDCMGRHFPRRKPAGS